VLDDIRPLRAVAGDPGILNREVSLFPTPAAYLAAYQQPNGSRFGADALFNGENRKEGAMITYYLKEGKKEGKPVKKDLDDKDKETDIPEAADDKKKTRDTVFLKIYDGERLIRTLKYKTPDSAGFHRVYWGLEEAGPDRPSRSLSTRNRERGGVTVKPGTYRVVVELGEVRDETSVTVKTDPRLNIEPQTLEARYDASKKLDGYMQAAADAVKQLLESKKIASQYQKDLKEKDKEQYKEQIEASTEISKEIDSLVAVYLGKEDKRQGITRNPEMTVTRRIYNAYGYVGSRPDGMTETENRLLGYAEADLQKALSATNAFFANRWKAYKESMEGLDLSPFKEIKTLRLE
jgi:hypothetical protein